MKCPQCGYQNKPDANSCNLCQGVLKKVPRAPEKEKAKGASGSAGQPTPASLPRALVTPATPAAPVVEPAATPGAEPVGKKHYLLRAGAPPILLEDGKTFTFGRQPTCSLPIPSSRVSRLHAEIRWENEKPIVADKNSSNGTFVGGRPVKDHALADGDELEIGPFHCTYRFYDPSAAAAPAADAAMEGTNTIAFKGDLFAGRIGEGGITEVLQTLEFNAKTGTLDVAWREGIASITVDKGIPLCAKAGEHQDEDAIFYLLSLKEGRYTFSPEMAGAEKRMKLSIGGILLEAARRQDEVANSGERPAP
ncbi:FHA domain-containing protein [bacterium]|nr:FHA domain-containing protein [bacterium]